MRRTLIAAVALLALNGLALAKMGPKWMKFDHALRAAQQTGLLVCVYAVADEKGASC